jgi:hypothetical protein
MILAVVALAASVSVGAATPSTRWMAHCTDNLKDAKLKPAVMRKYCACMGEVGEEKEMLTWSQAELERSYPPAHRQCYDKAHGRRVKPI